MIHIHDLSIQLKGFALRHIALTIEKGEFFALIGPTGAGKTLILESVAGLVKPTKGSIHIGGRDVTHLPPEKRTVGIVYQDQALFPHLSVRQNITFGIRYHRKANPAADESLNRLIGRLGLSQLLNRSIQNLSGGEKQRVALARALAVNPTVLLLDEPLSALDPNFRDDIRQLLKDLHQETGITVLMVTHDFADAHFLARQIAVINAGQIEQAGHITDVFQQPANRFVAEFVGMKNIFPAGITDDRAHAAGLIFRLNGAHFKDYSFIAIRPEHVKLVITPPIPQPLNVFEGTITQINTKGIFSEVLLYSGRCQFQSILTTSELLALNLSPGAAAFIQIAPENIHPIRNGSELSHQR